MNREIKGLLTLQMVLDICFLSYRLIATGINQVQFYHRKFLTNIDKGITSANIKNSYATAHVQFTICYCYYCMHQSQKHYQVPGNTVI